MSEKAQTIGQIISEIIARMKDVGYEEHTINEYYRQNFLCIAHYYRKKGITNYSPQVTDEFIELQKESLTRDEISYGYYKKMRVGAHKLNDFYLTGMIHVNSTKNGNVYELLPENARLLDNFLAYKDYGPNTKDDVVWVVRRYLRYLEKKGHDSLLTVTVDDVRQYIVETATEVKLSSLHNVLLNLKYFHLYLKEKNIPAPDCVELLSYRVCREMPIQGYVSETELEMIIKQIDTTSVKGKRNLAIIMLAATTGLRAVDIIRMKLTDIDWKKGEINIIQAKTDKRIVMPLIKETGEALKDYILNGRPRSIYGEIFLRLSSPTVPIMDASSIGDMFADYQKAAGINRQAFDGKGFHGLRRGLAKKLLVSGSSVEMVTQVLGHSNPASARQYLSLDSSNLKECALTFEGIAYNKEVYQYE